MTDVVTVHERDHGCFVLGVICGLGMLAWAGHGVATCQIHAKDGGRRNDRQFKRHYLIVRAEQPVQFWLTCATYAAVGVVVLLFATLLIVRQGALAHA